MGKIMNGNGNGIMTILAIIAGVAAVILPMQTSITNLDKRIEGVDAKIDDHVKGNGHIGTQKEISTMEARFVEVETQFKMYKQLVEQNQALQDKSTQCLQEQIQGEIDVIKSECADVKGHLKDVTETRLRDE